MNKIIVIVLLSISFIAEAQSVSALAVADDFYKTGNYSKAIEGYVALSETEYAFQIAKSYEAIGNSNEAIKYYEIGLKNDPENQVALSNYGKILSTTGQLVKADSVFANLISLYPTNPNHFYERGVLAEKRKDSLALRYYLSATLFDINHQNAIYRLARHWTTKRDFMAAGTFIERGLKANPNSNRFLTLNALVYYHSKSYHGAITAYEKLLALNQSNTQLHENLADSYMETLQFEKAIEQLTILINEYNDKNPGYHAQIGRAFSALKEDEKAIRHLELSIALQQVSLDKEYMLLSYIHKRKGDYKKVFETLGLAVEENPESEMVQYQYAVAADNYFKDKNSVLRYYERFLKKFGETGQFRELAKQRVSDIKEELHFSKD